MSDYTAEPTAVKRLERPRDGRMLAGVCGGLARYFGIHPAFYRVGFVVLTLLGGSGVLVYLAAYLVIPEEGKPDSIAGEALRHRGERPWPMIALSLLAVAGVVLLSRATIHPNSDGFWVLLLLAGLVILWVTRRPKRVAPDAPTAVLAAEDSRRVRHLGRTVTLVVAGLVVVTLASAATLGAIFDVHLRHGVGDRTYQVATVGALQSRYELGIGNLRVDLRDVRLPVGETHLKARVDIGNLDVIVPADAALQVNADAQAGRVDLLGSTADGRDVDKHLTQTGTRVLVLDAHVGAGNLHVSRAVR